jgi:hypothetical protein
LNQSIIFLNRFDYLDFLRTNQWSNEQQQSVKHLLYFANIQNSVGTEILNLLLNGELVSDTCQKLSYSREEDSRNYFVDFLKIYIFLLVI